MSKIRLENSEWIIDEGSKLGGRGGFGSVFIGSGEDGTEVAIKRIHAERIEEAHRELKIVRDLRRRDLQHVITYLDVGHDDNTDHTYIVMPKAETDLGAYLELKGKLSETEAVEILRQIVDGLIEAKDLVHRDIKPANVLLHGGKWKITDYGIAKYIEDTTSIATMKDFLSVKYAAPEQWHFKAASNATDIYALGCIAYELLTGAPPFAGPRKSDYRDQHLYETPERIKGINAFLGTIVLSMLRKTPEVRPGLENLSRQLYRVQHNISGEQLLTGLQALSKAGERSVLLETKRDAERTRERDIADARIELSIQAQEILRGILENMIKKVEEYAPTADITASLVLEGKIVLERGELEWLLMTPGGEPYSRNVFSSSGWDVISGGYIRVRQNDDRSKAYGANLWFVRMQESDPYRWHEVAYMNSPMTSAMYGYEPFELKDIKMADRAAGRAIEECQLAYRKGSILIDDEYAEEFIDRWLKRLALASEGRLLRPRHLPI